MSAVPGAPAIRTEASSAIGFPTHALSARFRLAAVAGTIAVLASPLPAALRGVVLACLLVAVPGYAVAGWISPTWRRPGRAPMSVVVTSGVAFVVLSSLPLVLLGWWHPGVIVAAVACSFVGATAVPGALAAVFGSPRSWAASMRAHPLLSVTIAVLAAGRATWAVAGPRGGHELAAVQASWWRQSGMVGLRDSVGLPRPSLALSALPLADASTPTLHVTRIAALLMFSALVVIACGWARERSGAAAAVCVAAVLGLSMTVGGGVGLLGVSTEASLVLMGAAWSLDGHRPSPRRLRIGGALLATAAVLSAFSAVIALGIVAARWLRTASDGPRSSIRCWRRNVPAVWGAASALGPALAARLVVLGTDGWLPVGPFGQLSELDGRSIRGDALLVAAMVLVIVPTRSASVGSVRELRQWWRRSAPPACVVAAAVIATLVDPQSRRAMVALAVVGLAVPFGEAAADVMRRRSIAIPIGVVLAACAVPALALQVVDATGRTDNGRTGTISAVLDGSGLLQTVNDPSGERAVFRRLVNSPRSAGLAVHTAGPSDELVRSGLVQTSRPGLWSRKQIVPGDADAAAPLQTAQPVSPATASLRARSSTAAG